MSSPCPSACLRLGLALRRHVLFVLGTALLLAVMVALPPGRKGPLSPQIARLSRDPQTVNGGSSHEHTVATPSPASSGDDAAPAAPLARLSRDQIARVVPLLRSVLFFGDSLTAGAYYREAPNGRLVLAASSWAPTVQRDLRRKLCALVVVAAPDSTSARGVDSAAEGGVMFPWAASMAQCLLSAPIHVTSKGYPGKASKALHDKLAKLPRLRDHSLVVVMSGTNDIVGMRGDLRAATTHIEAMHRLARAAVCPRATDRGEPLQSAAAVGHFDPNAPLAASYASSPSACGTIALLPPPFNYSLPPRWYSQHTPRGYCGGGKQPLAVAERGDRLRALLRASAVVGPCAMGWEGHRAMAHNLEAGNPSLWSDCLHPNARGYDVLGGIVATHVWGVVTGEGGQLCRG